MTVLNIGRAFVYTVYSLAHLGKYIFTPWVRIFKQITDGDLVQYAQNHAKKMGIQKEVVLIESSSSYQPSSSYNYEGNNLLPGPAAIWIPSGESLTENTKLKIIRSLAQIRANDGLKFTFVPVILALATKFLVNSKSHSGAALAEFNVGATAILGLIVWSEFNSNSRAKAILSREAVE